MRAAWDWYEGKAPMPLPQEEKPIPPKPYKPIDNEPVIIEPIDVKPVEPSPQPKPIEPIYEKSTPSENYFATTFYNADCRVRLPQSAKDNLVDCSPNSLADGWLNLCTDEMDNAIRDCLENRIKYNLCDWAYLQFLIDLSSKFCNNTNSATLLAAFIYCQSGYQIRLGEDNGTLVLLIGSKHFIYDYPYFEIGSEIFYPMADTSDKLQICSGSFESETPLSLYINSEQLLGFELSQERTVTSKEYSISATSEVPTDLIKFYNTYPTSVFGNNVLTRWAMYANTPLAEKTKNCLYPSLKKSIENSTKLQAANKLLNWVQTGFVYEYDDKVWGHDRAFFAEETLYYPYADCEDRSILFSRLVRDLLDLDVALIYYPGHLATAVKFDTDVDGDAMIINGERFIVCDPTYIGAPVGAQMPDLEYDKAQAIVLNH